MFYSSVFVCCANLAFVFVLADNLEDGYVVFRNTSIRRDLHPPMSMIRRINAITDEDEFIEQFVVHAERPSGKRTSRLTDVRQLSRDTEIEPHQIALNYASLGNGRFGDGVEVSTRFGGSQNDKSRPPTPKSARCQPELRTVDLRDVNDPTLVYFPCCTRVDRCGGCCTHGSLSCQPTEIEYKNFTVNVYKYIGDQKVEQLREKVVTVEIHKKCRCDCKIKARHCTTTQIYNEEECRCMCANKEDERKCPNDKFKLWNPSTCACECREILQCSTGLIFDQTSCRCVSRSQPPPSYDVQSRTGYNTYNSYPAYPGQ